MADFAARFDALEKEAKTSLVRLPTFIIADRRLNDTLDPLRTGVWKDAPVLLVDTFQDLQTELNKDRFRNMLMLVADGWGGKVDLNGQLRSLSELAVAWAGAVKTKVDDVFVLEGESDGTSPSGIDDFRKLLTAGTKQVNWKTSTVVIEFKGVFQCRLATDPDPSTEPRGIKGWTFAHTGEPNLDRIIRFNNPEASRTCAAKVGVTVKRVTIAGAQTADGIVGKAVDLGPKTFFDGGPSATVGTEPLANFEFHIGTGAGQNLSGKAGSPPAGLGLTQPITVAYQIWIVKRLKCLQKALTTATGNKKKALQERIDKVNEFAPPNGGIRAGALGFLVSYKGRIDKEVVLIPQSSAAIRMLWRRKVTSLSFDAKFSAFDGDGLVGEVTGSVSG